MKKMISLLLAMVMVFSIMPVAAFADETAPTIVFETTFAKDMTVGDTFTVTASIEADTNPGFNSFAFPLIWNENVLQFDGFNMTYDDDVEEDVLDTEALSAFEPMVYGGSIAGARSKDTKKDGMLFVANFTILAAGDLEIGFLMSNPSDTSKQFQMGNNAGDSLTVAAAENIDDSAIADLAVAGDDEPAGPAVPTGAPFTSVTTNGTGSIAYLSNTTVTYGNYTDVPYYHIQIPADATTVYVTHPVTQDPMVKPTADDYGAACAYGYLASVNLTEDSTEPFVWEHDSTNNGVELAFTEYVAGSHVTCAFPTDASFADYSGTKEGTVVKTEDGVIARAVSVETNTFDPICFFTFEYASEGGGSDTPTKPEWIPEGAQFIDMKTDKGETPVVTVVDGHYQVAVPYGTTRVDVVYPAGLITVDEFNYAYFPVTNCEDDKIDFAAVTQDGKTTIGMLMEKRTGNGLFVIDLITLGQKDTLRTVKVPAGDVTDELSFTYQLSEGQFFALLPEDTVGYYVSGDAVAADGYTFNVSIDEGYEATDDFAVMVNGKTVSTVDGDIIIADVTEDMVITVKGVSKIVENTDISVTFDLTDYVGTIGGSMSYMTQGYERNEIPLEVGKAVTLSLNAEDNMIFEIMPNDIGQDITHWEINGERYDATVSQDIGNFSTVRTLISQGTFQMTIKTQEPATYVIKPIQREPDPVVSNPITEIILTHPSITTGENGEALMTMVSGATEKINLSFAVEDADLDATEVVFWSVSDEKDAAGAAAAAGSVATVDQNGKLTAKGAGTAVITAKAVNEDGTATAAEGGEVMAQITLTVADPTDGYTVDMAEDDSFVASEDITVPVTVGHTDSQVEGFNAFEMIFTYDPDALTLTNESTDELKFQTEGNKITVERYGGDLNVGDTALTLTFTANATGETTVTLEEAYVGVSRELTDAQPASIIDSLTQINITGYSVNLPPEFEGDSIAVPGDSYTFEALDKFYDYTFEGSTVGDGDAIINDNGDGTFTIEAVSGNIVIKTQKTGKLFGIRLAADMAHVSGTVKVDDVDKVQYMTNYTAVLTKEDGYTYEDFTIAIGDEKNYTDYTSQVDEENGTITYMIPGADIKGDVVFSVTKTEVQPTEFTVNFQGDGAGDAAGDPKAEANKPYSFTLTKADGYTYTVTATMGSEPTELTESVDETTGVVTYTTVNVTGNILVTIAKVSDLAVTIHEYIDLEGKTIFLVNATQTLAEGESLSYDGVAMYFSTQYADSQVEGQTGQWSFLVVVDGEFTAETARAAITKGTAEFKTLSQTYDVNMSTKPDINDAQLVYDMYMKEYEDLEHAGMERFLNADVNADKVVDSRDAVAIVEEILK